MHSCLKASLIGQYVFAFMLSCQPLMYPDAVRRRVSFIFGFLLFFTCLNRWCLENTPARLNDAWVAFHSALHHFQMNLCCQSGSHYDGSESALLLSVQSTIHVVWVHVSVPTRVHSNPISYPPPPPLSFLNPFVALLNQPPRTLLTSFQIPFCNCVRCM